ncbi:hypothetical protein K440DRAFT_610474 [Wilcoxina mikolae CBS 423.85]|nr:hypothetical protein K440DRAFT_610474 [Wilcoxina mikolae CBS 423.85]
MRRKRGSVTPTPRLTAPAQKTVRTTPQKSPRKSPQKTAQKSPTKSPQKAPQKSPQKTPRAGKAPMKRKRDQEDYEANNHGTDDDESDEFVEENESGSDESESDFESGEWGGDGDDDEENTENNHLCIHCHYDEDNDPASDYEDLLECVVCAHFSHRQCDRNANESGGVKSAYDEESSTWRCPNCAASGEEPGSRLPAEPRTPQVRRKSPAKDKASRRLRKRKADDMDEDDGPISARRRKRRDKHKRTNGGIGHEEEEEEAEVGHDDKIMLTNGRRKRPKLGPDVTVTNESERLILRIGGLDPKKLAMILATAPKPMRRGGRSTSTSAIAGQRATPAPPAPPTATTTLYPVVHDDNKSKPYGGILSEADANTTDTLPGPEERTRFEVAKKKAEEEQKIRTEIMNDMNQSPNQGRQEKEQESKRVGEASLIECIHFGEYEIDTWYAAPYPEEYSLNKILWICEFCLKYMNSEYVCWRHKMKCPAKHPPGDEIYRDGSVSVFEIDGRKQPVYCQNLCLMAKLFLGSKTLYYDVHPFLFYVMTERDEHGMHLVGYFSKEKREGSQNNVSCIITLPIHQRKGYGNLLIDFSYLLTRVEKRTGSPEKPFSDLGLVSYRNYWKLKLCYELRHQKDPVTIGNLSERTGMTTDDIICGLEVLNALVRDPVTGFYALRLDYALFEAHIERWEAKGYIKLNPKALVWTPYLMGRSQAEHLNDMPLSTIAPRAGEQPKETEDDQKPSEETEKQTDDDAMAIDSHVITDDSLHGGSVNGSLPDSIDPALINNAPQSPEAAAAAQSSTNKKSVSLPPPAIIPSTVLAQIREIPPTRFEIVPPPPGTTARRSGVLRGTGKRGRPRLSSPSIRGQGKTRYGTPGTATRRGRTKLADVESVTPAPSRIPGSRRIVTKAPRMRSLTAEVARAGSSEGSVKGKGKEKSVASAVAAAATSTASSSEASSTAASPEGI